MYLKMVLLRNTTHKSTRMATLTEKFKRFGSWNVTIKKQQKECLGWKTPLNLVKAAFTVEGQLFVMFSNPAATSCCL